VSRTAVDRSGHARQFLSGGFVLLAMVVGMAVFFAARQRVDDESSRATMQTTIHLSELLSTVRQAESGLRGYLLTGNQASITTYRMALNDAPTELKQLDAAMAGEHEDTHLAQVHKLVAMKIAQLNAALTLYQGHDAPAAAALVNTDLNLATMQNLRSLVGGMQAAQLQRLADNESRDERNGLILQLATGLAVMFTLLLGSFAIRDSRLRTNALLQADAELQAINDELEIRIAERTASIKASEDRFRTLAESLLGLVFMADPDGNLTYVNNEFARYAGVDVSCLLGEFRGKVVHPEDMQAAGAAWRASLVSRAPFEVEYRLRRHDGVWRWFLARALPIIDDQGKLTAWIGNGTDIDDRKRAEERMAAANALLEQRVAERSRELDRLFKLSTDILTVTAPDTTYLSVSPAWERITGIPIAETIGKSFLDFVHPDDVAATIAAGERLNTGTAVSGYEHRARRADGTWCWISWRAAPRDEDGLAYSIGRDVTEEKAREEQLRQSQKMEVVGQLTGGIAHDFNNLLTIIMGSLELLQRGLPNADAKTLRRIEAAMDGGKRAAALTARLLAFARRQPLEPKPVEPNKLVAGMSDMLTRVLGENIALEFVHAAGIWRVQADVNQLENSILNLAVNARDAMPEGGHLTIETQNVHLDESYTSHHQDLVPGQYVMIAVTDTGTGMTPDVQQKVFEPFFTTKPQGRGTGLGLAQVYGFIRQSNGHVAIYSEPGQGTSVKIYLPRLRGVDTAAPAENQPAQPVLDLTRSGETILVVEDEENVRNFSVEVLSDAGYAVLAAENAARAVEILAAGAPIDMLFTDVVLTGTMNGRALADQIQRLRPGIAVLFTTGYTRNAIIHHGRLDEGIDFIGKPFTATALTQTVRKILDRAGTAPVSQLTE
jgi:PAS domain S-box-containing protein